MTPERPKVPNATDAVAAAMAFIAADDAWAAAISRSYESGGDASVEEEIRRMRERRAALSALRSALACDAEERKEIVAVLREAEFVPGDDIPHAQYCRFCEATGFPTRHRDGCRLAALLQRLEFSNAQ